MIKCSGRCAGAHSTNVPIVQRPRTWPFQGQNTGSNPVGDAIKGARLAIPENSRPSSTSPSKSIARAASVDPA